MFSLTMSSARLSGLCRAATTSWLRAWKYACQSVESSLSVQDRCQIAAPGRVTVRYPAAPARKPYSASSHLMNSGSGSPISSATSRGIRHIHQAL